MSAGAVLAHLRPRSWPIVFSHFLCGAAVAVLHCPPEARAAAILQAIAGGIMWTVFLNGGTLAINSAFDRDEGDIGYLDNPPPVPHGLAWFSVGLMAAGCAFSWFLLPRGFSWAIIACTLLSLLYSVPPVRLKAVAGADLLVNMAGYGALTFGAGALATGAITADVPHLGRMVAFLSLSFGFLFGAFYPMTQIYQIPEDMARGDRTLVVRLGARRALRLSLAMVVAAMVAQLSSTTPGRLELQAAGFFGVLFWACLWCVFTGDWLRRLDVYPHKKGMYRALKLWGLTDVATVVVFGFLAG